MTSPSVPWIDAGRLAEVMPMPDVVAAAAYRRSTSRKEQWLDGSSL
jgi:hypothetical protein